VWSSIKTNITRYLEVSRDDLLKIFVSLFYSKYIMVPVYCELNSLKREKFSVKKYGCEVLDVSSESSSSELTYIDRSRQLRVKPYFAKGYRCFALIKDNKVIGDIWYEKPMARGLWTHQDIVRLHIAPGMMDVYAFDMFVSPAERGKDITTAFMGEVLCHLRDAGYSNAYGCFRATNIPALWIHRLIGYKELPRVEFRRYLVIKTSRFVDR